VRVTDPGTGLVLLSHGIERPRGDLLVLQNEIVQEVGRALRQRLGKVIEIKERRAGTSSAVAWELLQRTEALREAASGMADAAAAGRALLQADSLLAVAEQDDPKWIEPIVLRGWLAYDQAGVPMVGNPTLGVSAGRTTAEWIRTGLAQADRALRAKPGDPAALELRGTIYFRMSWLSPAVNFPDLPHPLEMAERDLRAAAVIAYPSQARAWSTLGIVLEVAGKYAEAAHAAEKAYQADAFLRNGSDNVFRLYKTSLELERPADAIRWCEQGLRTYPTNWYFPFCRLQLFGWPLAPVATPRAAWQAVEDLQRAATPDEWIWLRPRIEMMAAAAIARGGLSDSAERVLSRARAAAPHDPQLDYYEAVARLRLGQTDSALALIAASIRVASEEKAYYLHHSLFSPLWNDPRFQALLRDTLPSSR
jgi:tetratricopeptide (TPR) repeat protein